MQTPQASLRAISQTTCRPTAAPSTQTGAEPRAVTNSWPWPASAIARAIATRAPPARLTLAGCRRSIERAVATRAGSNGSSHSPRSLALFRCPYTGLDAFARRSFSLVPRANPFQRVGKVVLDVRVGIGAGGGAAEPQLDLRPLRDDGELRPGGD